MVFVLDSTFPAMNSMTRLMPSVLCRPLPLPRLQLLLLQQQHMTLRLDLQVRCLMHPLCACDGLLLPVQSSRRWAACHILCMIVVCQQVACNFNQLMRCIQRDRMAKGAITYLSLCRLRRRVLRLLAATKVAEQVRQLQELYGSTSA